MNRAWEREIIEAGYRALAKQHHPDRGGNPENMRAINAAVARLRFIDESLRWMNGGTKPQHFPLDLDPILRDTLQYLISRFFPAGRRRR